MTQNELTNLLLNKVRLFEGFAPDVVAAIAAGSELCTFEAMVKSFGLKDKGLTEVAEIVHELDVKDDRYKRAESRGVEEILSGIRKTARDDAETLEKGMSVFEMLYASKR